MELIFIGITIFLSAFFSATETAFVSINRITLHARLEAGKLSARIVDFLTRNSDSFLGVILIGTNICDVATVVLFTQYMERLLPGSQLISLYVAVAVTPTVAVFATLIPKVIGREFADSMMYGLSPLFFIMYIVFFPVQFVFVKSIKFLLGLFGLKKKKGNFSKEEFHVLLEMTTDKGMLLQSEREFIESIMNFKNVRTREVMNPLIRMTCVEENDTVEIASALMLSTKHSRLPVFRMRVDNMIGYIENKALVNANKNDRVAKYIREAVFVPDSAPISRVLVNMQEKNVTMAFAVDEYGGVSGAISNQDIVSEIIGELMDKHEDWFVRDGDGYLINGMLDIEEMAEKLNMKIEKKDFETAAGYALARLERIPAQGDSFEDGNWKFEISAVSNVRIKQMRVTRRKKKERRRGPRTDGTPAAGTEAAK